MKKLARYLWPAPWTALGLACALAARAAGAHWSWHGGTLEATGGGLLKVWTCLPGCGRFGAITFGHVILAIDAPTAQALRAHEQVHVRQYETWGLLFVPAYVAASVWQWLRGHDPHHDNPFEQAARAL